MTGTIDIIDKLTQVAASDEHRIDRLEGQQ